MWRCKLKNLRWLIDHFEEVTSSLLIFIMSLFAFGNVLSRYVMNMSMNFTEELNVYFFVWLAFLGSAWAARKGAHMSVNMLYNVFSKRVRAILYLLIQLITICFFIVLGYCGYLEILDEIALNARTETLVVPVWLFTSATPIGSVLIIYRTLQKTREDFSKGAY